MQKQKKIRDIISVLMFSHAEEIKSEETAQRLYSNVLKEIKFHK